MTRAAGDPTAERIVEYTYDGLNRVRTETQYAGPGSTSGPLVMQTSYDANGNRATVTDQLNRTTTFSYDRLNRLTGIDYADPGTPDVSYTYDANGSRLTMTDGSGQTSYTYDELGRLLSVTTPSTPSNKTVGYRYDRDGNRTTLLYPTGEAVTYTFDKAGRLTQLADWLTPTPRQVTYDYFPDGALQRQTNWNGTVSEYRYDQARRLTEVWNKPSASATDAITRHTFSLDNVGNRTRIDETLAPLSPPALQPAPSGLPATHATPSPLAPAPGGLPTGHPMTASMAPSGLPTRPGPSASPTTQTLTYEYDRLYRLTGASGGPLGTTTYSYDPVGNRLTRTRALVTTTYNYDRADRITSAVSPSGGTSYTVDAVGNLTLRGADTLSYDQANRLTGLDFSSPTAPDASYSYDGDGKRVSKTIGTGPGATTTSYLYDVNRGLPVLLEDGAHRYVWGLGLAYEVEGSSALVYHTDGLGSVRALTDSAKAVVQTYEADEFGVPLPAQGGVSQPFGFTGEQHDPESGLVYLRARMYDPQLGRFISRDTVRGVISRTASLSLYHYSYNSPLNFVDPGGHRSTQRVLSEGFISNDSDNSVDGEEEVQYDENGNPYVPAVPYKPGSSGGPGAGKPFPWRVKREVLPEIGSQPCVYCGDPAEEVDHVIPRSKEGNNTVENAQPICKWCNTSKGNREGPNPKPPEMRSGSTGGGLPSRTGTGSGSLGTGSGRGGWRCHGAWQGELFRDAMIMRTLLQAGTERRPNRLLQNPMIKLSTLRAVPASCPMTTG